MSKSINFNTFKLSSLPRRQPISAYLAKFFPSVFGHNYAKSLARKSVSIMQALEDTLIDHIQDTSKATKVSEAVLQVFTNRLDIIDKDLNTALSAFRADMVWAFGEKASQVYSEESSEVRSVYFRIRKMLVTETRFLLRKEPLPQAIH